MKQKIYIFIFIIFLSFCCWYMFFSSKLESVPYATFESPDRNYLIQVVRYENFGNFMPGQSGDAPGLVILKTASGKILQKARVPMVNNVSAPEWKSNGVDIKFVADWRFK